MRDTILGKEYHRKWSAALLFIVYSVILFAMYSEYYFNDQFPLSGDGQQFASAVLFGPNTFLETGEFPLWNKWLAAGISNSSMFTYTLLFGFLSAKTMIYSIYIGTVALGAVFAYLYFREIKCSCLASLVTSMCYLLSIHLGGIRKSHSYIILAVAFFPIILFFIERYFTTRRLRWLLASTIPMALQFTCGIQYIVYTDIFLFIYLMAFGFHYRMQIATMLKHGLAWGFSYLGLIALYFIPYIEQIRAYGNVKAGGSSFEYFTSYSIHPIKLIQTIFPRFFQGEIFQALGPSYSSEMDIELFLGYIVLLLAIAAAVYTFHEFRTRLTLVFMGAVFLYSALGAFPWLAKIIFRIPYLGDFRCASRALFVFIFLEFTLAARGLTILQNKEYVKSFLKLTAIISGAIVACIGIASFSIVIFSGINAGFHVEAFQPLKQYLSDYISTELIWIVAMPIIFAGVYHLWEKRDTWGYPAVCIITAVATIAQTYSYTSMTQTSPVSALKSQDVVSKYLSEQIGDGKIWDAFSNIDGSHESILSFNRGVTKQIASINAYTAFNNPYLYRLFTQEAMAPMNSSGLLSGSLKAEQNLRLQNSLLSMLGVKYIIDSDDILDSNNDILQMNIESENVYFAEKLHIPNSDGELSVQQYDFLPEPNTYYQINFSCNVAQTQNLIFDLYAGSNYDGYAQEARFELAEGESRYSAIIYSGESNLHEGIVWRLISWGMEEFDLHGFEINRITTEKVEEYPLHIIAEHVPALLVPQEMEAVCVNQNVTVPNSNGELAVQQYAFLPEQDTYYQISFSCNAPQEQNLIFDLYAGPEYDAAEQETSFHLTSGENEYSAVIYSGKSNLYAEIVWRIISWGIEEFELSDFKITRLEILESTTEAVQAPSANIYLNERARDILYVPDAIEQIEDRELLYRDTVLYALDRINYMEEFSDRSLNPESTVLQAIEFDTNEITAQIQTEEDTFVNFSQCYYPGWHAYVDGEKTEIYLVNGVIMGMEVPAGTHDISFAYEPVSVMLGAAVTIGTAGILLTALVLTKKKEYAQSKIAG